MKHIIPIGITGDGSTVVGFCPDEFSDPRHITVRELAENINRNSPEGSASVDPDGTLCLHLNITGGSAGRIS